MGVSFLVNRKKEYEYRKTTINIRKTYYDQISNLDQSMTQFLDESIGKHLDVIDKSDEWIYSQINSKQRDIEGLKTLLTNRAKDRNKQKLLDERVKIEFDNFCIYLKEHIEENLENPYNTDRVNDQFGVNLIDHNHFKKVQRKYLNGSFCLNDFKNLKIK